MLLGRGAELLLQLHRNLRYVATIGGIAVIIIVDDVNGGRGILLDKHSRSAATSGHHSQFRRRLL